MEKGIKYRACYLTRPDLDSDDWADVGSVVVGREYDHPDDWSRWRIAEIQQDGTNVETIIFEPVT